MKPVILVTGAKGQLGSELEILHFSYPQYQWVFTNAAEMDLLSSASIDAAFAKYKPAVVINCAAYTAVDKAEEEAEIAHKINGEAPGIISAHCKKLDALFIHISTDYVFNGSGSEPYQPQQSTDPINAYGHTKREGEVAAITENPKTVIIRTSWVYSSFGKNFVKTMIELMQTRPQINVVSDQLGSPTYARDLARAILKVIVAGKEKYGIYHFTNDGVVSWADFAQEIKEIGGFNCLINPVPSSQFPTPARRPAYSVLDKTSFENDYDLSLQPWQKSLRECMQILMPIT